MNRYGCYYYPKLDFEPYLKGIAAGGGGGGSSRCCVFFPPTMDVCLYGGGMANVYTAGVLCLLWEIISKSHHQTRIRRIYGVSAGAIAGFFLVMVFEGKMNMSEFIFQINNRLRSAIRETPGNYVTPVWIDYIRSVIPVDFYLRCTGRLYVSYYQLAGSNSSKCLFQRVTTCTYSSNEDLIRKLQFSASIPGITVPLFDHHLHMDGIFPDRDPSMTTFVVNITRLTDYPMLARIQIKDHHYENIALRGVLDMYRFAYCRE